MLNLIKNFLYPRLHSLSAQEIEILAVPRSSKWKKVREEFLKNNPFCAICGAKQNIVPHHIVPVHMDKSKELDTNNLISLCETKSFNCHLFFGHYKNWTKYNSNIVEDAKIWSERITKS